MDKCPRFKAKGLNPSFSQIILVSDGEIKAYTVHRPCGPMHDDTWCVTAPTNVKSNRAKGVQMDYQLDVDASKLMKLVDKDLPTCKAENTDGKLLVEWTKTLTQA